jgi:hypothetical protein
MMDSVPEVLTRLNTRMETLESRVLLLEHPSETLAALPTPASTPLETAKLQVAETSSFTEAGATFPVLGKAMLGMAGAYALRAVAESGSLPKLAVIALAVAYAGMWLVWAVLLPAEEWFASTTYAGTSALILAPMLWELTLRFKFMSPAMAAGVLGAVVVATYALAWKRNLSSVLWVIDVAAAITAIALLISTHEMLPFLSVLLLMALLSEGAAARNRWTRVRPLVAAAVDIAICTLIAVYSSPESSRADYGNLTTTGLLAPALLLLLIYGTSIALRTTLLRQQMTLFEAGQTMIAFLIAADAVSHFGPASAVTVFGVFCLLLSPACYAAAFLLFNNTADRRNYHVYSTWAGALFMAGCFLCLSPLWLASCLGMAAIVATVLGARASRLTLEFHGLAYLIAAAFVCGLLQYAVHALAGTFPAPPVAIVWIIAASAVLCYTAGGRFQRASWKSTLFQLLSATLAVGALATALVSALVRLTSTVITPGASHVAVIRTLSACALALALAYFGPRWHRIELVWVTYATLVFVAAKLLLEDLQQGHPEFIAASIFLYAITLILVPQLVRRSTRKELQPRP